MQGYILSGFSQHEPSIMKILSFVVLGLFLSITALAGVIREGTLSAHSDGSYITIRWVSEDETNVAKYVLERKAGVAGTFMTLIELQPRGNNATYQFVDETAFRASESIYKYQIKVLFTTGQQPVVYGPITVSHKTSDVRRTWGSIKAMFR